MNNLPKISEAEYQIMEVIWDKFPISANDIISIISEKTQWNPKTIKTLISRLIKKEALSYEKKGRFFIYSPTVKKEEYMTEENRSFLNKFYNGALNSMILSFLKQEKLSDSDIKELKDILSTRNNIEEDNS